MRLWKSSLIAMLIGSLIGAPELALAQAAPRRVSAAQVIAAEGGVVTRSWVQLQIAKDSQDLRSKTQVLLQAAGKTAGGTAKTGGQLLLNDVLQAALIMIASGVAQLTKDRIERNRLAAGYQPKYEDVKKEAVEATAELFCGSKTSVTREVVCSGEFWVGTFGGWVTRFGVEMTVIKILQALLRTSPTRAALIELVGTTAASFLMLAGFQMSAHLWTQAVLLLNDPKAEEMAHKSFGRAVEMWATGRWNEYIQTEDGKVAAQVFENMHNILLVDSQQRHAWIGNAWRFGIARGEMIVNLTLLMQAMAIGTAVGTAAGATATGTAIAGSLAAVGVPSSIAAGAIPWLVATAVGVGLSAAIVYAPDLHVGEQITRLIQNTRAWLAASRHNSMRNSILNSSQAFDVHRFQQPYLIKYKKNWENRLRRTIPYLAQERMAWAGVAFEKYQDLRSKVDEAERTLAMAEEVVKNSELRKNVVLDGGGELMTYEQARERYCAGQVDFFTGQQTECDFPLSYQLKKIQSARKTIRSAEGTLTELADEIIAMYQSDSELFQNVLDNPQLSFPPDLSSLLKDEADGVGQLTEAMKYNLASLHPALRQKYGVDFDNEDDVKILSVKARDFIQQNYLLGFNEPKYLQRLKLYAGVQ